MILQFLKSKRLLTFMSALLSILLIASFVSAGTVYDSFPGPLIDGQKWQDREHVRETVGGRLALKVANTTNRNNIWLSTNFYDTPSVNTIESTITIQSSTICDTGTLAYSQSTARLQGYFYNINSSGGLTGEIWAGVFIGDWGSGLRAIWSVDKILDDNGDSWETIESGTLIGTGTLSHDTPYQVKISYDGNNGFTFEVDGQSASFTGPVRVRGPVNNHKALTVAALGNAGNGYISATFDDVIINNNNPTIYDDFSAAPLDQTKWSSLEAVREIANGKARMNVQAEGYTNQVTARFPDNNFNYFEAKFLVESGSLISSGARGIVRIGGTYYNETGTPYDGEKNDVWIENRITLNDSGSLYAWCHLWRLDTSDPWGPGTRLFYQEFTTPLSLDTEYTLSIERNGSQFIFKLNNETYTYNVTTAMHEVSGGQHRQIRARIDADPGETGYMKTTVDDVYNEKGGSAVGPVNLLLLQN